MKTSEFSADASNAALKELDGFVVYRPLSMASRNSMFLSCAGTSLCLSVEAVKQLGSPDYVVLFFDERKKRMMAMSGTAGMENAMRMQCASAQGGIKCRINCKPVCELTRKLAEAGNRSERLRFPGHSVEGAEGKIIFELSRPVTSGKAA